MCRVLEISPSGYYAWRKRPASKRTQRDAVLLRQIRTAHLASDGTYGAPRVYAELVDAGVRVGRDRVARLMREAWIVGVSHRRWNATTTRSDSGRQAPDLVDRQFTATQPNQLWVADITYIPTWTGFLFLAIVLDAWSRRIVGWAMATSGSAADRAARTRAWRRISPPSRCHTRRPKRSSHCSSGSWAGTTRAAITRRWERRRAAGETGGSAPPAPPFPRESSEVQEGPGPESGQPSTEGMSQKVLK
jgi:transposase InsO family protein